MFLLDIRYIVIRFLKLIRRNCVCQKKSPIFVWFELRLHLCGQWSDKGRPAFSAFDLFWSESMYILSTACCCPHEVWRTGRGLLLFLSYNQREVAAMCPLSLLVAIEPDTTVHTGLLLDTSAIPWWAGLGPGPQTATTWLIQFTCLWLKELSMKNYVWCLSSFSSGPSALTHNQVCLCLLALCLFNHLTINYHFKVVSIS